MTAPIHIGSTKQLFLDDHVVDTLENVVRQFHRPVRSPENPIIQADRPWERGGGGVYLFGGSVLYDEEDGHFKMWYRTSLPLKSSDIRRSQEPEGGYKACYAVSDDGVHWEKPSLGQTDFNGSKDNNILPPAIGGMQQIRRPNLIKDYEDPDPERRYKMIYMDNFEGKWALSKGYSRDGIAWRMNVGVPHAFESPVAPNGVLFGWDPRRREYVHYHRKSGMVPADVDGRLVRKKHAVMRTASPDFETWGDTREVLTPSDTDPPNWSPSHGVDLAGVLYTDDLYIGTVDSGATYHVEDFPDHLWDPFHRHEFAEYRTELVISRDGVMWRRAAPFWEFMRSGSWGTWDRDHVGLAKPIIYNDEMLIYYAGSNVPMGSNAPGHPLADVINTVRDGQWMAHAIGLATMRVDGFASMDAYREGGTLTTKPLVFDGESLEVNVRAPEKPFGAATDPPTPYGTFAVEILDGEGKTIEPFSVERCDTFTGDELRHTLTWNGSPDVTALAGETVALRLHQRNAALYAFQFVRPGTRQSPANLLAPGAKGTPLSNTRITRQQRKDDTMQDIRVGIIGAGAVAKARHIPRLKAIEGVELAMVWNRTLSKAKGVAREFGFDQAVADWRQIAESPDIDAIVIATPPGTHHEMTLASLAGGKHVLCQARMSRNLKEAHEMRNAAAASGRVTCLYPPLPGLKGDRTMLHLLHDEHYVGELREVRVIGMAAPAPRDSYDWRRDPDVTGLHLLTMGMWIEVLNRWVGPATSLAAKAGYHIDKVSNSDGEMVDATVPDSIAISADLECGVAASYHFSTEASFAGPHKIELYGSKGALIYTLFGDEIHGATAGMSSMQPIEPLPDEIRLQTTDAEFIQAIREGTPVHPSFDEGVQYMEFCEAVGQSVHIGKVVDLPPDPLMATWGRTLQ